MNDKHLLQGVWEVVEETSDGIPNENASGLLFIFDGDNYSTHNPHRPRPYSDSYTINSQQTPKHMTLSHDSLAGVLASTPHAQNCIYKLEGDVLTICSDFNYANDRPKDFSNDRGANHTVRVLKRVAHDARDVQKYFRL